MSKKKETNWEKKKDVIINYLATNSLCFNCLVRSTCLVSKGKAKDCIKAWKTWVEETE